MPNVSYLMHAYSFCEFSRLLHHQCDLYVFIKINKYHTTFLSNKYAAKMNLANIIGIKSHIFKFILN